MCPVINLWSGHEAREFITLLGGHGGDDPL
jgi:hypothetical protein